MDPACGSGHILVDAYELFKGIYLERGYRLRDISRLILEKNLFGLDIDGRAAQLAGFALMMKARGDDRRLFERGVKLNVIALVDSIAFDAERLAQGVNLTEYGLKAGDLTELERLFDYATTFGSLIQVPEGLAAKLPELKRLSEAASQDLFVSDALKRLEVLVQQARMLAAQYDAVVANPPYMGSKYYCSAVKQFVNSVYKEGSADLYGAFILRNIFLARKGGRVGMITIPNWMFLATFEKLRTVVFRSAPIASLVHNGRGVWGSDFGSCSFVLRRYSPQGFTGSFLRLFDKQGSVASNEGLEQRFHINPRFSTSNSNFERIPGSPVAYWVSDQIRRAFGSESSIGRQFTPRKGIDTGNNQLFLRLWFEVNLDDIGFGFSSEVESARSGRKWFPYNKGGEFRKWYGNFSYVVDWQESGARVRNYRDEKGNIRSNLRNTSYFFNTGVTWTDISSSCFGARFLPRGFICDNSGSACYGEERLLPLVLGMLASNVSFEFLRILNPTLHFQAGNLSSLPLPCVRQLRLAEITSRAVSISRSDWDACERSWDFQSLPLVIATAEPEPFLDSSYTAWIAKNRDIVVEIKRLEEENNRLFIDAYGLQDEVRPEVPIEQITLTVNPAYRYGGKLSEEEQWTRFREDTMQELVSYAIGCAMGRYRRDRPGLIYAHSGNERFWEIYDGGDRGEGRGASKELPRSDCVAEVDGVGGTGLPDDQSLSSGGAVRPEHSNSAGGGFDSIEHRGGPCPAEQRGVSELSLDRSGLQGRSGDTDLNRRASGVCDGSAGRNDPRSAGRVIQDAQHPATQTRPAPLIPNPFPPDADGIIPITDTDWFDDDAAHRVVEFISVAWDKAHLKENLKFLGYNLSPKKGESSRETIRRYLCDSFFKDHLQTYKKRPIYWCFSSGKQKAFQCLVYLHRYNEGTLARMRMEYVVPLQSKMAARIDRLADDIQDASTGAQAKRLQKERDKLTRQFDELRRFDEQLRHYADQRIALDLDDGVKVNYGKFGDLLAEVKAVTGKSE
jgi:hypothetical protein